MKLGVKDLNLAVSLDAGCGDFAWTLGVDCDYLGSDVDQLGDQALHVEYDLGDVLFYTGDS